ncbi:MAG: YqeG family HAD IIIA-type phosphatase [Gemella sp.]|nr:YqeG family HAD IIIA-type phosphatase [Gemella sp.]
MVLRKYFSPDDYIEKFDMIDIEYLNKYGIKAIISDLDNTLISWDSKNDTEDLKKWLTALKEAGIDIIILSNNNPTRVGDFCKGLDLDYIAKARKPLTSGFEKALDKLGKNPKEVMVLGDQLMTDILGSKRLGQVRSVLVKPVTNTDGWNTRVNRFFEAKIMALLQKNNEFPQMREK